MFIAWVIAISIPLIALMALHAPFNPTSGEAVAALAHVPSGNWTAIHVLGSGCGCSRRVAKHLATRKAITDLGLKERVFVLGGEIAFEHELKDAGYTIEHRDPDEVAEKFGIQGVPLLVVLRPDGTPAYSGGYSKYRISSDWMDESIIHAAQHDQASTALPVYGCAVGAHLMKQTDPFGLKYKTALAPKE